MNIRYIPIPVFKLPDIQFPIGQNFSVLPKSVPKHAPVRFAEWDFAVRENDCVLIEANANARNTEMQMGVFHGRKKQFEELEKLYMDSIS